MAMKVEAARLMVYTAAARAQRGEPGLSFISAAAKCFASDVAMDVTESAVQLLGGAGYTRDFPLERMMRDAKITQIYEGTKPDSAHRDVPRPARGLTPPRGDKEFAMHRTGEISAPDVGGADVV